MRVVLILLLLANLSLYAYTRLDSGNGDSVLLTDQVQPDKIKLLTPQQVAGLGPSKVAALNDVCVEWGPFADPERTRALVELEPLALGRLLTQKRVEFDGGYGVLAGPYPSRAAADARTGEIKRQGIRDVGAVDAGRGQFNVSLGVFRTERAASVYLDELTRKGVGPAKVERYAQAIAQTLLVVRSPPQAVMTRLKDMQALFPGTEIKIAGCERSS